MTKIKKLADEISEELCSAKEYAEESLSYKAKGDTGWANRYKEMALDELKHAGYIHERVTTEIETLKRVYTPPTEMMEKWEMDHKKYVEQTAWIKQMLAL